MSGSGMSRAEARSFALRVSVTERCGYHCPYCQPTGPSHEAAGRRSLSVSDYAVFSRALGGWPVRKLRFTGGEPLGRPDLPAIVRAFHEALPGVPLGLTSNGRLLSKRLDELVDAGLGQVTVHLDSLRPGRYRALMGGGDVDAIVRAAIEASARLDEVKINTVVQRGRNVDELGDFLTLSRLSGLQVRFIELMNTGSAAGYTHEAFFSAAEILDTIRRIAGASPIPRSDPRDPASLWRTDDGVTFGVIASDTMAFCHACDRLRLSAEGRLRGCLYQPFGLDLRPLLDADDQPALTAALAGMLAAKHSYHPVEGQSKRRLPFSMAEVGG